MTRKTIKLIAPDKNGILEYQGECKLTIDARFSKALIVEPKYKDFLDICAFFRWKFIPKKNLLFVFAELKIQDFVLIFANEKICKKVHDIIYRYKEEENVVEENEFQQRLLIPIFRKLPQNYSTRFKRVIIDWIEQHENEERMELIKLYKKRNIPIMDIKNVKQEPNAQIIRKRRFSEMENNNNHFASNEDEQNNDLNMVDLNDVKSEDDIDIVQPKKKKEDSSKIINESMYKIVAFKYQNCVRRKLLIFTSSEKSQCYEFNFYPKKQIFYHRCDTNSNGLKAFVQLNKNGNERIMLEKKKHRCSPIKHDSNKYEEIKIVKKPDYKILDNCFTQSKRMLIIFHSNDRNQCYEYFWESAKNKFFCCGCNAKKKYTKAEICYENTDAEYILILKNEHVCELRTYDPKKHLESNNFVISPNFEIETKIKKNGIERKTLIIFYGNDRKMCYTYYFATTQNIFYCNGCNQKRKTVSAKLCQNDDGEEYVILSNVKHFCSPKEYIPQPKVLILRSPKIKLLESTESFKSKLFIFASNDNQLCYIFSKCPGENSKKYYCLGCKKLTKTMKEVCVVILCQNDGDSNDSDEYYVKMANDQKHICKPQVYDPENFHTKIFKPKDDYVLFQKKDKKKDDSVGLVIYDSNDKSFCFKFHYCKSENLFRCLECKKKKVNITAKIQQDSDGNEYIEMNQKKHVCKPIKVSSFIKPNTLILEKIGLFVEPKKKKEIDESRIIRLPNFELQKNAKGVPERKLIIFYGDDKQLCYEYGHAHTFVCYKCKISATLHFDVKNNNEKYIILGPTEHSCEPVKYEPEKIKILTSSDFMIFNQNDDSKLTKLIIFTSPTKKECYEYTFIKKEKLFRCCDCYASKKKYVSAKLLKNSEGQEYIQLLKTDHICKPKKFVLEEFQPKIISENGFKLCSNKNRKENSKLILFDSEKNGFCFEYTLHSNKLFKCIQCDYKKKRVTARLCQKENGEKYFELSAEKHICKSIKYDPEIYKENEKIFGNFVVQHNSSGDPKSRLTIFNENDKTFGYQFYSAQNYFRCYGCSTKNKSTRVKLKTDEEGKQYLELTKKTDHVCSIQNLKEKNLIFDKPDFEENGNILIAIHPNINDQFYKFKYNEEIGAYCCIKCKIEKKKIITATKCNGNDGKEFWLLNNKHFCTAFSK